MAKNQNSKENSKPSDREKKYIKKLAQEKKKLDKIISFPSRALFLISLIIGLITFTYSYFGSTGDPMSSILTGFFAFSIIFIGFGFAMIMFFYFKSERIKEDIEKQKLKERNEREAEAQLRYNKEISELESIEKELYDKKNKNSKQKPNINQEVKNIEKPKAMTDEEAYLEEVLNSGFNKS
jgi:hypothetical protein